MLGVSFHRLSLAVSRFAVYRFSSAKSKKDTLKLDLKEEQEGFIFGIQRKENSI